MLYQTPANSLLFFPSSPFSARQDCRQQWRWTEGPGFRSQFGRFLAAGKTYSPTTRASGSASRIQIPILIPSVPGDACRPPAHPWHSTVECLSHHFASHLPTFLSRKRFPNHFLEIHQADTPFQLFKSLFFFTRPRRALAFLYSLWHPGCNTSRRNHTTNCSQDHPVRKENQREVAKWKAEKQKTDLASKLCRLPRALGLHCYR